MPVLVASVLLLSSVANADDAGMYERERIEARASIASSRTVDGLDYYGEEGVLSAGILYSNPSGLYVASQLLHGEGDGVLLPATGMTSLESALGWIMFLGEHDLSFELQDYRQRQSAYGDTEYRGAVLYYRYRGITAELGFENDRPLYYRPLDRYLEYHKRRLVLAYGFPLDADINLQLAAGRHQIDRIDIDYEHASLRLDWRWQRLNWWLGYSVVSDDVERFYSSDVERQTVSFGVAATFELD